MKTDTEISELWQVAHLRFHFGENLAMNALLSPKASVEYGAPVEAIAPSNDSESRKEPDSLKVPSLATKIA